MADDSKVFSQEGRLQIIIGARLGGHRASLMMQDAESAENSRRPVAPRWCVALCATILCRTEILRALVVNKFYWRDGVNEFASDNVTRVRCVVPVVRVSFEVYFPVTMATCTPLSRLVCYKVRSGTVYVNNPTLCALQPEQTHQISKHFT